MTRQRIYQRRHMARGLCLVCSRPALSVRHCARHLLAERRRRRADMGYGAWAAGGRGAMPMHTDAELEAMVAREDREEDLNALMQDVHREIMFAHFMRAS